MNGEQRDGYLIEFQQARGAIKVSAIDPLTGIEVSIVGAPNATQAELSRLAVQKLQYRLNKERQKAEAEAKSSRRGIII